MLKEKDVIQWQHRKVDGQKHNQINQTNGTSGIMPDGDNLYLFLLLRNSGGFHLVQRHCSLLTCERSAVHAGIAGRMRCLGPSE